MLANASYGSIPYGSLIQTELAPVALQITSGRPATVLMSTRAPAILVSRRYPVTTLRTASARTVLDMGRPRDPEKEALWRKRISEALKRRTPKNITTIAGWNKGKPAPWAVAFNKSRIGQPAWNKGITGKYHSPMNGKKRTVWGTTHWNWRGAVDKPAYGGTMRS